MTTTPGRLCFHLAECEGDPPFRFLATLASSSLRHQLLGDALQRAVGQKPALLAIMQAIDAVSRESALIRQLVESGELLRVLPWSPAEAHRFLREIKLYEKCGVAVRAPEWCRQERLPRVQVAVKIGEVEPARVGLNALLDFSVGLAVGNSALSDDEWCALRESADGLCRVRGEWVEVDRDEVESALSRWRAAERPDKKIHYAEGVRLLSGLAEVQQEGAPVWSKIEAGPWLEGVLSGLRGPDGLRSVDPGPELRAELRPYQRAGVSWLHFLIQLGLGACLADDMGLGKTVQIIALLLALQQEGASADRPHLIVAPASLLGNWQAEIQKFAPTLRVLCAHPSAIASAELRELSPWRLRGVDLVLTTYGTVPRLPWMLERDWGVAILDEAQAIKNPSAKQSRAVKSLRALGRVALTGTPVENRLSDIWSLFDFINPGLLGSLKQFQQLCRQMRGSSPDDAADYAPLRDLVRPYILRRLKSDRSVIADLPDKTELVAYCSLTPAQAVLYQQAVDELAVALKGGQSDPDEGSSPSATGAAPQRALQRRNAILTFLLRFKQICNHPSHWLGDKIYAPQDSGKFERLRELVETIAEREEKVLVFTQYRELCDPLADFLSGVFDRPGLVLHGETPIKERRALVERFQTDAAIPFFVLSVKAGGTGLNLTAASHVIHFDRWWNPAAEDQATDRAYRIGQHRNVLVHKFVCRGTIEEKIDSLIESKKSLSRELLSEGGEVLLTEMSDSELINLVTLDLGRALGDA